MQTAKEIISIIDGNLKDHQTEIEATTKELDKYRKLVAEDQDKVKRLENSGKLMILKDKIMFHKAALITLADIKYTIQKTYIGA